MGRLCWAWAWPSLNHVQSLSGLCPRAAHRQRGPVPPTVPFMSRIYPAVWIGRKTRSLKCLPWTLLVLFLLRLIASSGQVGESVSPLGHILSSSSLKCPRHCPLVNVSAVIGPHTKASSPSTTCLPVSGYVLIWGAHLPCSLVVTFLSTPVSPRMGMDDVWTGHSENHTHRGSAIVIPKR